MKLLPAKGSTNLIGSLPEKEVRKRRRKNSMPCKEIKNEEGFLVPKGGG